MFYLEDKIMSEAKSREILHNLNNQVSFVIDEIETGGLQCTLKTQMLLYDLINEIWNY